MAEDLPLLLLLGKATCAQRGTIEAALTTQWRIEEWLPGDDEDQLKALMQEAVATVTGGDALMTGPVLKALGNAPRLKLLQLPFTGFEWLNFKSIGSGIQVANAYGHEVAMAEFVMGALLQWEKDFCAIEKDFRSGSWKYRAVGVPGLEQGELAGKTIGIVGYGSIGREIARRAAAFDMRVVAVSRSERTTPAPLDWYGTMDQMGRLLEESDYAVLACEMNEETRSLIGATQLAQLGPKGTLVNVARGAVADEDALFEALSKSQIRGAILDVWYQYPSTVPPNPSDGGRPPSRHDFLSLPNILATPHCSANTEGSDVRRYLGIALNIDLVAKGQPPATLVGVGTKP